MDKSEVVANLIGVIFIFSLIGLLVYFQYNDIKIDKILNTQPVQPDIHNIFPT